MRWNSPLTELKGIGDKTAQLFRRIGIDTVGELLCYYPRRYDVYEEPVRLVNLEAGRVQAVTGFVRKGPAVGGNARMKITTLGLEEFGDRLNLTWFNMPYLHSTVHAGETYIFRGLVQKKKGRLQMEQPVVFRPEDYAKLLDTMQPVYGLTAGLSNKTVTKAVRQVLEALNKGDLTAEFLPEEIRRRQNLPACLSSLQAIHFPVKRGDLEQAQRRLVFDEFFLFILTLRRLREKTEAEPNHYPMRPGRQVEALLGSLPYSLTGAQLRAWKDLQADLCGSGTMNRLIQGDVGSGKTILALLALLTAAENGYQGALMAPTEVLARQHAEDIARQLSAIGSPCEVLLLTGSLSSEEKREARERIRDGRASIVVGTHALIQKSVQFQKLALVVTDEQHRFGVHQRETLASQGEVPHVLVMSATPIPRTLAIILYGDLDISVIDELPASRLPIKNCVIDGSYREKAYRFLEKECRLGHQAYVICPMVEDNPELDLENVVDYAEKLRQALPSSIAIAYLHGRMKPAEKTAVMERFASGEIQILVSTTVIEVGINVPNATVMLVENAERFGLAQLHQLRGRVGRGSCQSYCIFLSENDSPDTRQRLDILNRSNDGFYIASEDLKLRGPGDIFGVRQTGLLEFQIADVFRDAAVLKEAAAEADRLLEADPELTAPEHRALAQRLEQNRLYMERTLSL